MVPKHSGGSARKLPVVRAVIVVLAVVSGGWVSACGEDNGSRETLTPTKLPTTTSATSSVDHTVVTITGSTTSTGDGDSYTSSTTSTTISLTTPTLSPSDTTTSPTVESGQPPRSDTSTDGP